ncbi:hypothetical protein CA262_09695 [Sphingobium sp. GW456-12-10-14-TSB1]|nr:hypothetical protein CA262_09695 [Sphingobium sp. GW456-12-10-14-TSB1]
MTEGCRPHDRVTPLHHFVVPLPLQGRNEKATMSPASRGRDRPPDRATAAAPRHSRTSAASCPER